MSDDVRQQGGVSAEGRMILDTARRILDDTCDEAAVEGIEQGEWPATLWRHLEDNGLTRLGIPEEYGGLGGSEWDALAVLRLLASYAAPVPYAETWLAGRYLARAGIDLPAGPLSIGVATPTADKVVVDEVAYGRFADHVVVLVPDGLVLVAQSRLAVAPATNLAGEPRDTLTIEGEALHDPTATNGNLDEYRQAGAILRSAMIAGALDTVLELSIDHALNRIQFGRPIAAFQAIQQNLAVMAGEVAAATRAADLGAERLAGGSDCQVAAAVAKARTGEAAGIVAETAHQVHGAMGFTREHRLHRLTRRLWSWRDEYGHEAVWQAILGDRVAQEGADGLWPFVCES